MQRVLVHAQGTLEVQHQISGRRLRDDVAVGVDDAATILAHKRARRVSGSRTCPLLEMPDDLVLAERFTANVPVELPIPDVEEHPLAVLTGLGERIGSRFDH